jgi:hypothetical protein
LIGEDGSPSQIFQWSAEAVHSPDTECFFSDVEAIALLLKKIEPSHMAIWRTIESDQDVGKMIAEGRVKSGE